MEEKCTNRFKIWRLGVILIGELLAVLKENLEEKTISL